MNEEKRTRTLEIIQGFERGDETDWSNVETVFTAVKPLLATPQPAYTVHVAEGRAFITFGNRECCGICSNPTGVAPYDEAGEPERAHEACIRDLWSIDPEGRR